MLLTIFTTRHVRVRALHFFNFFLIFTTRHVRVKALRAGSVVVELHVSSYYYICVLMLLYIYYQARESEGAAFFYCIFNLYLLPGTCE